MVTWPSCDQMWSQDKYGHRHMKQFLQGSCLRPMKVVLFESAIFQVLKICSTPFNPAVEFLYFHLNQTISQGDSLCAISEHLIKHLRNSHSLLQWRTVKNMRLVQSWAVIVPRHLLSDNEYKIKNSNLVFRLHERSESGIANWDCACELLIVTNTYIHVRMNYWGRCDFYLWWPII